MQLPNLQQIPVSAGLDVIFDAYQADGCVVIKGFLSHTEVEKINREVQPALDGLQLGKPGCALEDFLGRHTKRLPVTPHSQTFRDGPLENDLVHGLSERVFVKEPGDGYHINCAQIIDLSPGSKAQPLHRDQDLWPFWKYVPPSGPEACINFLCALTPFTEVNGATRVAPRTHLDPYQGAISTTETVPVEMNPGDALFFSGKLVHGGGENMTDGLRRGLAMHIARSGLLTEEAHALTIPRAIAETMSYRAQAMFGFRSTWPIDHGPVSTFWANNFEEIGEHLGLKKKQPIVA
ncbi:uncharacterized protein N7483_011582 [Penicillium malachiteum]|uniref:uncharacterized protein n=1 Tax=Penicillium malachiteum TaxID=1324776 RepID=UPI0025491C97|nr:uncharacterized protein N7483_011582 [Penicillium malachiteum]KAJ5714401.1 hypothetical protein N7483_011582 [Penicillium malachiteum]